MRLFRRLTLGAATLISAAAALGVVGYGALLAAGFRPVVVYSGSMAPALPVGSLVALRSTPAASVRVGDVITFRSPYDRDRLVTHRVVGIAERHGARVYRTKGDANPAPDPWQIELPGEIGTPRFSVPWAGYALLYASTREARQAAILAFAAMFLVSVLRRIWRQPAPLAPIEAEERST
jgi:signal peptidase I